MLSLHANKKRETDCFPQNIFMPPPPKENLVSRNFQKKRIVMDS